MFTKSIGRWRQTASRRRDERDVRIHPEARELPGRSATPHKRARGAAGALYQIKAEAPTAPAPLPDAFSFESFALAWMDQDIARMRGDAADKESRANQLLGEASRLRTAADTWERLRRIADVFTADEPPAPVVEEPQVDGSLPYEVVTQVEDEHMAVVARFGSRAEAEAYVMRPPSSLARVDLFVVGPDDPDAQPWKSAAEAAEQIASELPEPLTSAAPRTTGPAAVPQFRQRDTETIRLPWGPPAVLSDTLTDLMALDGVEQ